MAYPVTITPFQRIVGIGICEGGGTAPKAQFPNSRCANFFLDADLVKQQPKSCEMPHRLADLKCIPCTWLSLVTCVDVKRILPFVSASIFIASTITLHSLGSGPPEPIKQLVLPMTS